MTFIPQDQHRQLVQVLRANGTAVKIIARNIGIDIKTLNKHFRVELNSGKEQVIAALGASVIKAGPNGDWRAAIAWLSRFGGPQWRDSRVIGAMPDAPFPSVAPRLVIQLVGSDGSEESTEEGYDTTTTINSC